MRRSLGEKKPLSLNSNKIIGNGQKARIFASVLCVAWKERKQASIARNVTINVIGRGLFLSMRSKFL